jgi:MazG family protein
MAEDGTVSREQTSFSALVGLMARLRSPDGCPWDREQDHRSLRRCLLEETYEVLEAIDRGDWRGLREELGDLLLQVVFHAQLAAEADRFGIEDVIDGLREKLVSRHPHVFGDASAETPAQVLEQWHHLKREERGEAGADSFEDVPSSLPALSRAHVLQRRAARQGLARSGEDARAAAEEVLARLGREEGEDREVEEAVAELLFAAVDLARSLGVDAEQALREHLNRLVAEARQSGPASSS